MALTLDTPVGALHGVGPQRAGLLAMAGLGTVRDLLYFLPFRYEDRRKVARICDLGSIDEPATVRGRIISCSARVSPIRKLRIVEAILDDGSGRIALVWFNHPWIAEQIRRDDQLLVYGQARLNNRGRLQFDSPAFERLDPSGESDEEGVIVPIYPGIAGIPPKSLRRLQAQALEAVGTMIDPMPKGIRDQLEVLSLNEALLQMHRPTKTIEGMVPGRSRALERLVLDEFVMFQAGLWLRRRQEEQESKGRRLVVTDEIRDRVRAMLPFKLTSGQKRVLREIVGDLRSDRPMYRLLQGDVGSGKTIVSLVAALTAIANGWQVALMAPTEILAEQHEQRTRQLLDVQGVSGPGGITVAKLTGSMPPAERARTLSRLARGEIDLLIGTHALLEDRVRFRNLGLAIIDEQQRFGVEQRRKLFAKGQMPDALVMTATPIPRSLALATHGDLDLSVIDGLPPGRQPVKTVVRGTSRLPAVFRFLAERIAANERIYLVYPIIEESDRLDLTPLTRGFEEVRLAMPDARVAMLHGRMPSAEKESTMNRFSQGEIDVLVSTTVIEVGIDVREATVMVIVGADRFGLAQMHQLRGRVGRGDQKSWCVLIRNETAAEDAKERLRLFASTRDGFEVAQRDLELRGAGDVAGIRQAGLAQFRFGDIVRDSDLMERARNLVIALVDDDPELVATLARSPVGMPRAAGERRD